LRVAAWEEVVKLLDSLPDAEVATQEYRLWMLRLLESYGLRPVEGPLDWHDAPGRQDVAGVRRVCGIFDGVTKQVQADQSVAEVLPPPYLPDGALRLLNYMLIAGKGEGRQTRTWRRRACCCARSSGPRDPGLPLRGCARACARPRWTAPWRSP
jgi:hypothetical protein